MSLGVGAYKVGGAGQCSTNSKQLQQHFVKNRKQATAYISHEVPLVEASGHPNYSWGNC